MQVDAGEGEVRTSMDMPGHSARSFLLRDLTPDTKYTYFFEGIAGAQIHDLKDSVTASPPPASSSHCGL